MNTKQFIIASLCFALGSLGLMAGLTILMTKILVPPSGFEAFVVNTIGGFGPLIVLILSYILAVGLMYLCTRKFIVPKLMK